MVLSMYSIVSSRGASECDVHMVSVGAFNHARLYRHITRVVAWNIFFFFGRVVLFYRKKGQLAVLEDYVDSAI